MKKTIHCILNISLLILCILGIKNNVYAVESNRSINGVEIKKTQAELKDLWYKAEMGDSDMKASLRNFTVVNDKGEDEYWRLGDVGFAQKTIINDIDYRNKYFLFESANYLGENFFVEGMGTFEYQGYNQSITFDENFYIYKCKITSNDFKRKDREIRFFEITETDLETGEQHINKIVFTFYKKLFREDKETGIKLEGTTEVLPDTTKMITEKLDEKNITIEDKDRNHIQAYDITLTSNDIKIQPKGEIKINIPIPDNFDTKNLAIYRIENGKKIKYDVNIINIENKLYANFKTDHFSTYVLAGNLKTNENEQIDNNKSESVQGTVNQEIKNEQHKLDNEPKTGIIDIVPIVVAILGTSIIGLYISRKKI